MSNVSVQQMFHYTENQMFILSSHVPDNSEIIRNATHPKAASIQGIKLYELQDAINGYVHLQQNWDSYNADPISRAAINTALEVLNQLNKDDIFSKGIAVHVFPMRNGGIQFEFDADGRHSTPLCAELEIDIDGQVFLILFDEDANVIEKNIIYEFSEISVLLEDARYNG